MNGEGVRGRERKRDDLWALGKGEPHEYPSLSGREGRARKRKGLDGGAWGAEGERANEAPNHILHLRVILGAYICMCVYVTVCIVNVGQ